MEIGGRNFLTVRADVNSNELSKHCIALNDKSVLQATDLRRNFTYILVITINQTKLRQKNSKVFEQKGDLLNFKANNDPMALLSQVKLSLIKLSLNKLSQAGPSWA